MSRIIIKNATIVNEGRIFKGSVVVENERISQVVEGEGDMLKTDGEDFQVSVYNARGLYLLPGVIDTHVHFRDGGLSDNPAGTFESESRAAIAGGVTSVIDMPNTTPQTTTLEALERKEALAARVSAVNYGFMLGATNNNIDQLLATNPARYAALKLFLGSSTGNMLVNNPQVLDHLFEHAQKLIVAHCEDENIIQANLHNYKLEYQGTAGESAALHPKVRNIEACYLSTYHAVERARRYGTRLHIAHLSTATELNLLSNFDPSQKNITAEVTPNHLWFDERDYATLGNLIKCNPAIKSPDDRLALWAGLYDGLIDTIATDHAPHPIEAKQRPYFDAPSGIPSIQHSLQMMLEPAMNPAGKSADDPNFGPEWLTILVQKMCHNPATIFGIKERGYIRPGYKADLVLVEQANETVTPQSLRYRCGWSPLEGQTLHSRIRQVLINGQPTSANSPAIGQPLQF